MARTNPKPLHIGVIGIPIGDPTLMRFQEKGHVVEDVSKGAIDQSFYDVIIGPRCWRIDTRMRLGEDSTEEESLERQLEMMEKGVRAIKFSKGVKDVPKDKA